MSLDIFILPLKNGYHDLISGRSFLVRRGVVSQPQALWQCRAAIAETIRKQDGDTPLRRTLAERRHLYGAP
jgi:hypothetical protein